MNQLKDRKLHTHRKELEKLKAKFREIDEALEKRKKVPPFGSLLNVSDVKKKLKELEQIVSAALLEHHEIIKKSEEIIKKHNNILRKARTESKQMIETYEKQLWDEPIIKQAEEKAREILLEAKEKEKEIIESALREREEIQKDVYAYSNDVLNDVERMLLLRIQELQENKKNLNETLESLKEESGDLRKIQ